MRWLNWFETVSGVKGDLAGAAAYWYVAGLVLLFAVVWPRLSLENLVRSGLIAGIWATMGFVRYLGVISRSRAEGKTDLHVRH